MRMPKLADTLVEGTVARWRKGVGDVVARGDVLCEIETDKVSTELQAPVAGTVLELLAPEGQPVLVDSIIARLGPPTATTDDGGVPRGAPDAGEAGTSGALEPPRARPTSVAARMLADRGLSPEQVPCAPGARRLSKQDVLRYVRNSTAPTHSLAATPGATGTGEAPDASRLVPVSPMRRAIAEHMRLARATIPHGQAVSQVDLTDLAAWREREKGAFEQREGARLTFTVLFAAAFARALRDAALPGSRGGPVDLGVAVAVEGGLMVPVLRGADQRSLGDLARGVQELAERARGGRLGLEEMRGAVATVSNVGTFGNLLAFPIIPVGQAAILAPGVIESRPWPTRTGMIRQGACCFLTLVFDRRLFSDLSADVLLRAIETWAADLATGMDAAALPAAGGTGHPGVGGHTDAVAREGRVDLVL